MTSLYFLEELCYNIYSKKAIAEASEIAVFFMQ